MDKQDSGILAANADCMARARQAAAKISGEGARIEAGRELPADIVQILHDARLFRLMLPRALGGDELDPMSLACVTEEIAAADASTAWCLGQGSGCAMAAAFLKPDAAQRLFGPSNAVLAWGAGIQGTAIAVEGGYRISGKWRFASGSRHATLLGGHSYIVEADGTPRLGEDGQQQNATALIPRDKATIDDVWHVMGLRGTGSDSYEVKDLFVSDNDMIKRSDRTTLKNAGPVYKIPTSLVYAGAFGGVMLGIARGMVRDLTALAANKTPRGKTSALRDDPVFQRDLARLEARLRAARSYHMLTLAEVWQHVSTHHEISLQHRLDIRLAATHAINEGAQIVVDAHRQAGEHAIFDSGPFERRLRDALSASQQVQGRATHYLTVGRHLLGLEPDSTMFI